MRELNKIPFYRRTVYLALFAVLLTNLAAILVFKDQEAKHGKALVHSFVEDFSTADFKNSNTTADWDTVNQEIKLKTDADGFYGFNAGQENISSSTSNNASSPFLAINASNTPYVSWSDHFPEYGYQIAISHWDGTQWAKMDGTAGYDIVSDVSYWGQNQYQPQIAFDSSNNPYVTWGYYYGGQKNSITRWDGTQWAKMDGTAGYETISVFSDSISVYPQIAIDANNVVYISNSDYIGVNWQTVLTHWDGTQWAKMDGTAGYDNVSNNTQVGNNITRLVLSNDSRPYVSWFNIIDGYWESVLTQWDGTQWAKMDGTAGYDNVSSTTESLQADQLAIELDSNNNPYVSWFNSVNNSLQAVLTHWDGTQWAKMDGTAGFSVVSNCTSGSIRFIDLAINNNIPYLVWNEHNSSVGSLWQVVLTHWDGTQWAKMNGSVGLDNISNSNGNAYNPSSLVVDSEGEPQIAWADVNSQYSDRWQIYFTKHYSQDVYINNQSARSNKVNVAAPGVNIESAMITPAAELNNGTINYFLSNNGGINWQPATPGEALSFSTAGSDLRWRTDFFSSSNFETPVINSIAIDYSVIDINAPIVSTVSVLASSSKNNVDLNISFTDIDGAQGTTSGAVSGVASYQLSNNGTDWTNDIVIDQPYANGTIIAYADWDLTQYGGDASAGSKSIHIKVKDRDGNISSEQSSLIQTLDAEFESGVNEGAVINSNSVRFNSPGLSRLMADTEVPAESVVYEYTFSKTEEVSALSNGNFVYSYFNDTDRNFYFQVYDGTGQKIGESVLIDHNSDWLFDVVTITDNFLVIYHPDENNQDMVAVKYQNNGGFVGSSTIMTGNYTSWKGYKAEEYNGGFKLAYYDNSDSAFRISTFDSQLNEISSSTALALAGKGFDYSGFFGFDVAPSGESLISVGYTCGWNCGESDMYAAFFDAGDNLISDNVKVNQHETDRISRYNGVASVVANSNNDFLVSWYYSDNNDYTSRVYSRVFTASGTPKTDEVKIADLGMGKNSYNYIYSSPASVDLNNGNFLVSFEQFGSQFNRHIVGQYVSYDGVLIGQSFKMETNELTTDSKKFSRNPSLALNNQGVVLLGFFDARSNTGNPTRQVHFVNTWQLGMDTTGQYISAIIDLGQSSTISKLSWSKATTTGQTVKVLVRAGNQPDLSDGEWSDETGTASLSELALNYQNKKYFQYKLLFEALSAPAVVYDVTITYNGIATGNWNIEAEPVVSTVKPSNSVSTSMLQTISNSFRSMFKSLTKTEEKNTTKDTKTEVPAAGMPDATPATPTPAKPTTPTTKPVANVTKPVVATPTITKYLTQGQRNTQVKALQDILAKQGYLRSKDATGYFGLVTKQALIKFQKANKIQATGTVGPATRKALNGVK